MWMMMAAGIWPTGTRGQPRPARVALIVMSCYIAVMLMSSWVARGRRGRQLEAGAGHRVAYLDGRSVAALAV